MKIQTSRFGTVDIDEASVIHIAGGLIGFPDHESYVLIRHNPETPFFWLQAVDGPDLAFVIVQPRIFKPDYKVPLPQFLLTALEAASPDDVEIFVIVTIPQGQPEGMTANLLGPLIVNSGARTARQIVLDDHRYSHRHPILPPAPGKSKPANK